MLKEEDSHQMWEGTCWWLTHMVPKEITKASAGFIKAQAQFRFLGG